jgi:hypothetical protein
MAKTAESRPVVEEQAAEEAAPECCLKPVHTLVEDYSGQGGSFVLDSSTGQRTLVHQTKPATEA